MIYRFNRYVFFFIIYFLCIPSVVIGADKPTLRVNFEIKEENYRDSFGEQVTLIEKEINERAIELLNSNLMFLHFEDSLSGGEQDINKLNIILDRREKGDSVSQLHEVGFWMSLSGSAVGGAGGQLYTKFRPDEYYNRPLGRPEGFTEEVSLIFKKFTNNNRDTLMEKLFSNIVIANEAFLLPERLRWILPLAKNKISAETESKFRINTSEFDDLGMKVARNFETILMGETTDRSTMVPERYRKGMVVTEIISPDNQVSDIQSNDIFLNIEVYLMKYIPSGQSINTVSPDNFNAGITGGVE